MTGLKSSIGRQIFRLAGIERIHIVGCSRSGTTLLHLAMMRFSGVTISRTETSVRHPYLPERAKLALVLGRSPGRKHYVTKRPYEWHRPGPLAELIACTKAEDIGIIHMVRDPRDVLSSAYRGSRSEAAGRPYVDAQHWYDSVLAGDRLMAALSRHRRKMTLRYEDLVQQPLTAEDAIAGVFGLQKNPLCAPIDRVKDNFERLNIQFWDEGIRALHGLRNMDARSVGGWRQKDAGSMIDAMPQEMRRRCEDFCAEHGYA
jgi:hypothetical protein